jgi:sugar O-acyltransferase (sialic acid O-acetyltransferase NeuD family)
MIKKIFFYGSAGHFVEIYQWFKDMVNNTTEQLEFKGVINDIDQNISGNFKTFKSNQLKYSDDIFIVIAVGDIELRKKCINQFSKFNFLNIIHPSAIIAEDVNLGKGICVAPYSVISAKVEIENFNNINSFSLISHNCTLGKNNFLSSHSKIMGNCKIGENNFIGTNTTIIQNLEIKNNNLLGANTLINKNLGSYKLVFGSPGKIIKNL